MTRLRPYSWFTPYAFVLPGFSILGIFVLWSFCQVVILSFTQVDLFARGGGLLAHARFVGFANYVQTIGSNRFWWCLANSLLYLLVTPAILLVSLSAALTVTSGLRGLSSLRILLFLPVVTPTIVGSIAWRILFREDGGLLNAAITHLGLQPVPWLTGYPWVLVTAMIVTLWKGFGYYMMIFVAALMAVSPELEEACMIDGAGRAGVFWNVTFPSIRPVVVMVALLSSISALKVFDEIFVTVRNIPTTSKTVVPLIFDTAFEQGNFGLACAIGVLLFAIILVFSLLNLRFTREK
jgi:putative chitobiose transport system permease protein